MDFDSCERFFIYFHLCPKTWDPFLHNVATIHDSDLREFQENSLMHAQHLDCAWILCFEELDVESRNNILIYFHSYYHK